MSEIEINAGIVRYETGQWQAVLTADCDWEESRARAFARRMAIWAETEVGVERDGDALKDRVMKAAIKALVKSAGKQPSEQWEMVLRAVDEAGWMMVPQAHVDAMRNEVDHHVPASPEEN
jgi:hypothetical protein